MQKHAEQETGKATEQWRRMFYVLYTGENGCKVDVEIQAGADSTGGKRRCPTVLLDSVSG